MPIDRHGPAAPGDKSFLNDPQLRHFEVFLSMLETALNEIEWLASPGPTTEGKNLVIFDSDLPGDFMTRAEPAIGAIRQEIAGLSRTLGIEPRHRSRVRTVKALVTAELVRLDDSYARKLRGYGVVNPRVEAEVDPILDRMRTGIVALLRAAEHDPPESTPMAHR
ncbi:MAG: hypothetical protein ACR2NS_11425 [Gemmatimonadaceae bacterium]